MARRYFRPGSTTFHCRTCGRHTRITTQHGGSELCAECEELAGQENSVLDRCQTVEEVAPYRDELVADAVKKGGNLEMIREHFKILWESRK